MNYKDVVNRIQESVEKHKMLVDFGYGQASDIKTRAQGNEGETEGADYPYLFLNPTQHVRTQQQITYNFNMIVMDMAREEEAHVYQNFLNIQSDCIQYIDDIVARLYYFYKDKPEVSMDLNYTPFYERFQDDLAGATATLSITVPNPINECIAPFEPEPVPPVLSLSIASTSDQLFRPDVAQSPLGFQDIIIDLQGPWEAPTWTGWRNPGLNYFKPSTAGTWRFVLTGEVVLDLDQGDWPDSPDVVLRLDGTLTQTAPTTSTWPVTQPAIGVPTPFECVWEDYQYIPDEPGNPNDDFLQWNWINDPQVEDHFEILAGATLTGVFTPTI